MPSIASQANNVAVSVARGVRWRRWLYRGAGLVVVAAGGLLLGVNLELLRAEVAQAVALSAAGVLILAGLRAALGWPRLAVALPSFAVRRGDYECAELAARTGTADLQVRAFAGTTQLAVGVFPSERGPALVERGGVARLVLERRQALPYLPGPWSAALAKGLPWSLDLRSSLGHFDLDLRDLTVQALALHSPFGSAELTLPTQGAARIEVDLLLGDLTLRVPDGAGVRLKVEAGPLATVRVDEKRLAPVGEREWATGPQPGCCVTVRAWAGDVVVGG